MSRARSPKPTLRLVDSSKLSRPKWDAYFAPGLISDYYQVGPGYHICRRNGTPTAYLVYTLSGRGFFRDRLDRFIEVKKGDLTLIDARVYQEYGILPEASYWKCHWTHFEVQPHFSRWLPLPVDSGLEGVSSAHVSSRALHSQISDLFFELHTELTAKRRDRWREALAFNLLERVLILARSATEGASGRPRDPRIWRVLEVIERKADDPPSIAELAAIAGLSPSRLSHLFKQQTGVSLLTAANRVRLRAARDALDQPGTTLSQAAEAAGFSSPYSFSNWFHKQTGTRPGAYQVDAVRRLKRHGTG